MALNATSGGDFASILSAAQRRPEAGDENGRELPDGFPFNPPSTHGVVSDLADPSAIEGVVKYAMKVHREVFTIWRDWQSCTRCKDLIAGGKAALPSDGEYECPHNNKEAYEAVINQILAGRLILGSEQEIVQQRDSSVLISLRWFEKILSKKEKRAIVKEKALSGE